MCWLDVGVFAWNSPESCSSPASWFWPRSSCPLLPVMQCPSALKHTVTQLGSKIRNRISATVRKWHNWTICLNFSKCNCRANANLILSGVSLRFLQGAKLKYNHSKTWCIIEDENSAGIRRKVNFIHKGESVERREGRKKSLGSESGPQKLPCARVQPWNQPDPIDSVYLARLQVKAIGNLGEIWRRLWFRERGGEWAKK